MKNFSFLDEFRILKKRMLDPSDPIEVVKNVEDNTIFNEFQKNFKEGKLKNRVHSMHEHAGYLYELIKEFNLRNIIEFGRGIGGSTLVLGAAAKAVDGKLLSVEPRYKNKKFVQGNLRYWGLNSSCELFCGYDSFSFRKFYHDTFQDKSIDFLFLDSGHTYLDTKKEIELWEPLIKDGGVVVFHDIVWCFDSVQAAIDEFLRDKKAVYIKSDGFMKRQCERCMTTKDRPIINDKGRPVFQSPEVFDSPSYARNKTFWDYNSENITHQEAKRKGYDYSYEMRTNCMGLGVLMKHISYNEKYTGVINYKSNWDQVPWNKRFYD